jgi:amylosucrase
VQNVHAMRREVRADYERARALATGDDAFATRFERFFTELRDPLVEIYADDPRFPAQWQALLAAIAQAAAARAPELRALDHEREITPDWLQREQTLGYVTYVDRFAGTLQGVRERLPYLTELGITYLHLMPLLEARPEPNDGGYAVTDYGAVDPRLGTMDDLRALAGDLREAGIALCIDLVLNHTAREHAWTRTALERYRTFPDRTRPDAYERTLPEVFPDTAPGNFTWIDELDRWVWTTFNAYQWDLDYSNPEVFVAMAKAILDLANVGVDVLRLDAVPFLWKREGTNCQNQPEVHRLLQAFKTLLRIAAPAVACKAEAIVAPHDLVSYLESCDLAYHNSLMVLLWSSLASGKTALMTSTLRNMPRTPPHAAWITYVRCHDDIGWAITEQDAAAVGEDGYLHRRFLADFYAGDFPGSFAGGARFQPDPRTGEARTSGTTASLAGLGNGDDDELAIRRILLLHAIAFAFGGVPLIYMGDEVGLRNDPAWADDPAHADDNRWMHRPPMDWTAAERRHDPASPEARLYTGLKRLAHARRSTRATHAQGITEALWTGNDHVFGLWREHGGEGLLVLANFTAAEQSIHLGPVWERGLHPTPDAALPDGRPLSMGGEFLTLGPYQHLWIA